MTKRTRKLIKVIAAGLGIACAVTLMTSCGEPTVHVAVSGRLDHGVDISGLVEYFQTACARSLGPTAAQAAIDACVDHDIRKLFNFVESLH